MHALKLDKSDVSDGARFMIGRCNGSRRMRKDKRKY